MPPLPGAHGSFLVIEIGNWLLTLICLIVAWRHSRTLFGLMIGSTFLGYALEASQTTKNPAPYEYTQAIVSLPGNVPLGIVLSWGMILFAVWHTIDQLQFGWLRHALAGGLLAVTLDFVTDPAFVYLDFWIWKLPTQYFGIPFSNFVGWFVIVTTFFASLRGAFHFFPPDKRPAWTVVLIALGCIVPAFLSFVGIMLAYEALLNYGPSWLTEPRLVLLYMVPPAAYVATGLKRPAPLAAAPAVAPAAPSIDRLTLVVPGYLIVASVITFTCTSMQATYPQLAIIYPVVIALLGICFIGPLSRSRSLSS